MKLHVALIVPLLLLMPLVALAKGGVVPKKSVVIDGLDVDSMRARLDETDMQPLEGIWYYPNEEMTLGIERYHGKHNIGYRIILLESPDINVMPGTVIGYIAATAVDSKYQLWLYSQRDRVTLIKPLECVATHLRPATLEGQGQAQRRPVPANAVQCREHRSRKNGRATARGIPQNLSRRCWKQEV